MRANTNFPISLVSAMALSGSQGLASRQLLSPALSPALGISKFTEGNQLLWKSKFSNQGFAVPAMFRFSGMQNQYAGPRYQLNDINDDTVETDLDELARIWEELGIIPPQSKKAPKPEVDIDPIGRWTPPAAEQKERYERPGLRIPQEEFDPERQRRWEEDRQRIDEENTPKRGVYIWDPNSDEGL